MSRKKISTTVYITPEQSDRLHLLHSRTKVPVAVYIREGIDLVLEKYRDQLPGQMTLAPAALAPAALTPAPKPVAAVAAAATPTPVAAVAKPRG